MNPCACGWGVLPARPCTCTPDQVARYAGKVSGPLLDRLDLAIELPAAAPDWLDGPPGESSAAVGVRVVRCRERPHQRQGGPYPGLQRSEERRVRKGLASTCRTRWVPLY